MIRTTLLLVLAGAVLAPSLAIHAQTAIEKPASPACLPSATVDQLPGALDDAISGPADKDRTCLRQLMMPDARLVLMSDGAPRFLGVDDWIEAVSKRGSVVMFERQIKVVTERFGGIAQLWCTYELRSTADGKATVRGLNSIQAIFDGQRWRIVNVLWQAETPADPIPDKYLP